MPFGETQRVNEQFNVLGPDQKPVGTFKTAGEAEAVVTKAVGEDVFKQTQQNRETAKELYKTFVPQMRKFGLGDVGLNIVDRIENGAGGAYLNKLIRVSLEDTKPVQTMRHEALHAMKDLGFFKPQQWKALEDRANKQWIKEFLEGQKTKVDGQEMTRLEGYRKLGYSEQDIVEEAIADAFGAYDKGAKPPPGMIASLYKKIKDFFASLGQAFRGAGFQSADDIFQQIERGRLKPAAEAKPAAQEKLSIKAPETPAFKKWFGDSKVKDAGGKPLVVYHGTAYDIKEFQPSRGGLIYFARSPSAAEYYMGLAAYDKRERAEYGEEVDDAEKSVYPVYLSVQNPFDPDNKTHLAKLPTEAANKIRKTRGEFEGIEEYASAIKAAGFDGVYVRESSDSPRSDMDIAVFSPTQIKSATGNIGAYSPESPDIRYSLAKPSAANAWQADAETIKAADKFEEDNGIRPYVSEGFLDLPIKAPKYSLQKFNPDKHLKFDPTLGVPINKDGTVTVYYHTTKQKSLAIGQNKVIPSEGRNRVYLTNESGGDAILRNRGSFDQELDGSTVLVYVTPDMLQLDAEYDNGRRDFFIPLAQGDFFNKKMKMQSIQKGRQTAITEEFSYDDHEKRITKSVQAYKDATPAERKKLVSAARKLLKKEHNVGNLLSENGKLEKTRVGEYGLDYEGNSVASQGLGLAAAQKISEKVSTCPRSAICEGLCLGETSGGNFMFGGIASEDVEDIAKSAFRAGPRMMQYLKTEALIINPEAFSTVLQAEIDSLKKWSASQTQIKINPETKKREQVAKEIYQPAVRLNVTSDFKPEMFRAVIDGNPDVQFYDYTKLGSEPIAANHHLTYSSTGFGQIVNGEKVFFKTKTGQYDHNWATMRDRRLNNGQNVAMAFSSKSALPKFLVDEETGARYRIWDGDDYDARFLDPKQPDGKGLIIGLRNKAGNLSEKNATQKTGGFFVQYDPKKDGDTVVAPDQAQFKGAGRKVIPVAKTEKFSLKAPTSPEFKRWFGDSKIVNKDGTPMVMYHGLAKDTTDFTRKTERGAPIFLTDDPEFATRFAADSYESVARNPEKYLSKEQIDGGVKRAIAAIKKDYGKDSLGKEMIESLKTGNLKDATPEAREYIQKEFINLLPTGPHIMPMYVRAERPFDYENPSHIRRVLAELTEDAYDPADIRSGNWESIENADFQDAIQNAGFDSFYVKEHGRKNLAVYQPNQVKSATGNVGTYSLESPDVRYSLRGVAFPTAKEAQEAAEAVKVPDTPEFKQYIAGSQWVDEDGKAKKFFHATTSNFFEFNDGVIYLSDTAEESAKWGRMAEDRLRERIYKALNKDEKLPFFQQAVDEAVSKDKITKAQGEKFMRDATRNIPDFDSYDLIKKEMDDVLLSLSPERMKIMPLYARAMTPFDFRNKEHVQQVINAFDYTETMDRKVGDVAKQINKQIGGAPTVNVEQILDGLKGILAQGYPKVVERPDIMRTIRKLGFDGYAVRRNRTAPMSYAVFSPRQVKSVTANEGPYSLESKDIRYSLRKFTKDELPSKGRMYVLPADTMIYHGAYKERADQIEKTGGVLLSRPPMKVSGGLINEGGLIFFGGEETAKNFAESRADPTTVQYAREAGIERLPGKVFETMTDRPYRLIRRDYEINAAEAKALNKALGLPDYKSLSAGKSLEIAASRANEFRNSNIERYKVTGPTGEQQEISAPWPVILRTLNVDGFFDNFAIALTADNGIRLIGEDGKLAKYSMPTLSKDTVNRIKEVAPQRYQPGWKERVIGTFKPDYTELRQRFLNRYETFANYDERNQAKIRAAGGPELLADQRAEFAALHSDLSAGVAASAMGIGDRQGGVPVYRNGFTTIDTSVKGLTEALAPLAKYDKPTSTEDADIYSKYQFWAGWKRGRRLLREGREQVYTAADAKRAQEIEKNHPEFIQVQKDLIAFNNGIVNYAVQTGVLSRERAQLYTKYSDYIPFYRQLDLDKTIGPNPFGGISGVKGPKELKGGESPLGDFLENMVRNTQSMINAGMKNAAAQRATKVALEIKEVERLPGKADGLGFDVYTQLENGQLVYYRSSDSLFIEALKSLNMPDLPFMGLLSAPANVLRNLVTKDPGFMMANLLRDSLSSYVTSGQKITPIVGTMVNFGKALSAKDKNLQALFNAGIIGGYEFSQNIEQSGQSLSDDLNKKAGKDPILLRPFKSLWEGLEKGTTASDAATRMAVYERVMKETGNEAEAISRALEVMNFNRKGNSVLIRIATAALPFFNARLQGLDLFYRASTGQMNTQDAKEIQKRFWIRGMTMSALSVMYYLSVADDEEYEKQEEETKDNNWIFPIFGIRIPIPFEVGTLFKTMPERITAYLMGNDTGKELGQSTLRALANTFALNPIPQTFKPIIEAATNYNFFTMRPIVGQGMQEVEARFQVGPGTSKSAEYIGGILNLSPLKVDQVIKGYTGTIGGYVTDVVDSIVSQFSDVPKASLRFEQLPVVKRFVSDPEARGSVTQFYELQRSVDTVVRTMSLLEKTARPEEFAKYLEDNIGLLAVKDYVRDIEKSMKELREMRRTINSSPMEPDEKRDILIDLGRMENNLTANIGQVKKAISDLK
jgi:hypothetical protein